MTVQAVAYRRGQSGGTHEYMSNADTYSRNIYGRATLGVPVAGKRVAGHQYWTYITLQHNVVMLNTFWTAESSILVNCQQTVANPHDMRIEICLRLQSKNRKLPCINFLKISWSLLQITLMTLFARVTYIGNTQLCTV